MTPVRVVLLTLDNHVSAALDSAFLRLKRLVPGLQLAVHAAADWEARPDRLAACRDDIVATAATRPECVPAARHAGHIFTQ